MLKNIVKKVDSWVNEWEMSDETEILEKSQMEMLENKCMVVNLKNSFDVIISRKSITDKKNKWTWIHSNRNYPNYITKKKKQRKKEQRIQYVWDNIKWPNIYVLGMKVGETGAEEVTQNFSKTDERPQPTNCRLQG